MSLIHQFIRDEKGQDLIEYTLLLAFVALVSALIFIGAGQQVTGIWTMASRHLSNTNTKAGS